jgi:16S rRNA (uracil1498-N3)-methyltransferase
MRIFVAPLAAGELIVRGDEHHYVSRVRRARPGDPIELVDGAGQRASAVVVRIGEDETVVRAGPVESVPRAVPHVRVLVPLIKGERMDYAIEKLVEVGADELVVWPAARSVVKLDPGRREARLAHYRAVAAAAARQAGCSVPEVRFAVSLATALTDIPAGGRVVLDPSADAGPLPGGADVTVVSGPEGGLAPTERELLAGSGFVAVGLGGHVLRAETAPVVAVALIRHP